MPDKTIELVQAVNADIAAKYTRAQATKVVLTNANLFYGDNANPDARGSITGQYVGDNGPVDYWTVSVGDNELVGWDGTPDGLLSIAITLLGEVKR